MSDVKYVAKLAGLIAVFFTALALFLGPMNLLGKIFSADKIVFNYEWFYDTEKAFEAKLPQIAELKTQFDAEQDKEERVMLRTELNGVRQVCRELAATYNSNSQKLNRNIFKSNSLPYMLDQESCK